MKYSLLILLALLSGLALAQATPKVDGIVSPGEYANSTSSKIGVQFYWTLKGDLLYIGLKSPAKGWVGIGFETVAEHTEKGPLEMGEKHPAMHGSDLIMGYVKDGRTVVDEYHGAAAGQPQPYSKMGSKANIVQSAGRETPQGTTLELVRRLNMGSPMHVNLQAVVGHKIGIMLAYSDQKAFAYHGPTNRVALEITLR